jgi:hypothetical protein
MKRGEIRLVSLKGKTTGVIRCGQPRALDLAPHGARKLEKHS